MRGCNGVVYEPIDPRCQQYLARDLLGAATPVSVTPLIEYVHVPDTGWQDQGVAESCCGFAIKQAIYIRQGAMGIPAHKRICPSEIDIYYRGRAARVGYQNVIDIGANPHLCWEVLRRSGSQYGLGIVPYDLLPYDAWAVDDPPDPALYRRSVDHDWLEYRWILDVGKARCDELDALLQAGHPVACAVTCDESILRWNSLTGPWSFTGPIVGGHYVCLIHVDEAGDYWAVGSWGGDYGVGGLHHIARHEIASARTSYLATPVIEPRKIHV